MKKTQMALMVFIMVLGFSSQCFASIDQLKLYRKVYPQFKPNCAYCHISDKPKKEDGQHELNAYGKKARETAGEEKPTEEIYKQLGAHDQFKEEPAAADSGEVQQGEIAVESQLEEENKAE